MSPELDWETVRESALSLSDRRKLELIRSLTESLLQIDADADGNRRIALDELRREMAALPVSNPTDGLSNRDHDRLLYGARP